MHCASVPTETEPAGHTFVSSVPYKNPAGVGAVVGTLVGALVGASVGAFV